ncbi:hypothetical protein RHS01_04526 [Rhizoctonia solani]|uniref:Metacaspase-1 n=1 Tax=Rhizoctonia solani TaxID=456999 RepID=A0A8H7IGA9_9AGAM|nr:hypothetical protein RHS01_04526 [Rhizoctonia solani]
MATSYSTNGQRALPVPAPKSESSDSGVVKEEAQSSTLPNLRDRRLKGRRTPTRSHGASGGTDYNTPPPASIRATDTLTINPHLTNPKPARGSTKTISSPPTTPPSTAYASRTPISRRRRRKALLIGLNYNQSGKLDLSGKPVRKMDPLKHAVRDAWRFASALTRNTRDANCNRRTESTLASSQYILECLDWLIQGVCKGDRLFLMWHCVNPGFMDRDTEPYLAAGDHMPIHKSTLHERLIGKVPAGAELVIVLDCCNAASMVKLKYCVGRMDDNHEVTGTNTTQVLSELGQSVNLSTNVFPQSGSLHGMSAVAQLPPIAPLQLEPINASRAFFGTPSGPMPRHRNGNVAAAPIFRIPIGASNLQPPMRRRVDPPSGRRTVVEALPITGNVVLWAGTGEHQKAFEAYGNVMNGIVTNALCSTLDNSKKSVVTQHTLWKSLVGAVGEENKWRKERAKKPSRWLPICACSNRSYGRRKNRALLRRLIPIHSSRASPQKTIASCP